jgi:hypothetical protein
VDHVEKLNVGEEQKNLVVDILSAQGQRVRKDAEANAFVRKKGKVRVCRQNADEPVVNKFKY